MSAPVHELLPLNLVPAGATARVAQLVGQPDEVHRLNELGLGEGAALEIVQAGVPCIVRIGGHKLCFRDSEGFRILVRLGADA